MSIDICVEVGLCEQPNLDPFPDEGCPDQEFERKAILGKPEVVQIWGSCKLRLRSAQVIDYDVQHCNVSTP